MGLEIESFFNSIDDSGRTPQRLYGFHDDFLMPVNTDTSVPYERYIGLKYELGRKTELKDTKIIVKTSHSAGKELLSYVIDEVNDSRGERFLSLVPGVTAKRKDGTYGLNDLNEIPKKEELKPGEISSPLLFFAVVDGRDHRDDRFVYMPFTNNTDYRFLVINDNITIRFPRGIFGSFRGSTDRGNEVNFRWGQMVRLKKRLLKFDRKGDQVILTLDGPKGNKNTISVKDPVLFARLKEEHQFGEIGSEDFDQWVDMIAPNIGDNIGGAFKLVGRIPFRYVYEFSFPLGNSENTSEFSGILREYPYAIEKYREFLRKNGFSINKRKAAPDEMKQMEEILMGPD